MAYYMLGFDHYNTLHTKSVAYVITFLTLYTYSPHLWCTSIPYQMMEWWEAITLKRLATLPKEKAIKLQQDAIIKIISTIM